MILREVEQVGKQDANSLGFIFKEFIYVFLEGGEEGETSRMCPDLG